MLEDKYTRRYAGRVLSVSLDDRIFTARGILLRSANRKQTLGNSQPDGTAHIRTSRDIANVTPRFVGVYSEPRMRLELAARRPKPFSMFRLKSSDQDSRSLVGCDFEKAPGFIRSRRATRATTMPLYCAGWTLLGYVIPPQPSRGPPWPSCLSSCLQRMLSVRVDRLGTNKSKDHGPSSIFRQRNSWNITHTNMAGRGGHTAALAP
jgi:hypothetical protein